MFMRSRLSPLIAFVLALSIGAQALAVPASAPAPTAGPQSTTDTNGGAPGTGIAAPSGGSGFLGYLSGIYHALTGTLTVTQVDGAGNAVSYENPMKVALPAAITVIYTLASGSTGMMIPSAVNPIRTSGYLSADCTPITIPSGMAWSYESSDGPSSNDPFHAQVGPADSSPGNQFSGDSTYLSRWIPNPGSQFGILVTIPGTAGTGTLTIECTFSMVPVLDSTVTSIILAAVGGARRTSQAVGNQSAFNKTFDDAVWIAPVPTSDANAGLVYQSSTALTGCQTFSPSHGATPSGGNVYEVRAHSTDTQQDLELIFDALTAPSDGAVTPLASVAVPANGDAPPFPSPGMPPFHVVNGLTVCLSTNASPFTKTATSAHGQIFARIQ